MERIKNALIMPLLGTMDFCEGGVFDSGGNFREDSLPRRGSGRYLVSPQKNVKGTIIYGGCLYGHFGHFIWETLSRLAAVRKCRKYPICFLSPNQKIFPSQSLFLKNLGVHNKIILIKDPTLIDDLIYSSPESSIEPLYISNEQIDALTCYDFSADFNDDRIWLSRSKLIDGKCGKISNEQKLENILKIVGYKVVYPETLSFYDQVRIISTAKVVAGFDGSQFFSLFFAHKIHGKFIVFNRRDNIPPTLGYAFDRKGIPYDLYNFRVKCVSGDTHKANANFDAIEVDKIVDVIKQHI